MVLKLLLIFHLWKVIFNTGGVSYQCSINLFCLKLRFIDIQRKKTFTLSLTVSKLIILLQGNATFTHFKFSLFYSINSKRCSLRITFVEQALWIQQIFRVLVSLFKLSKQTNNPKVLLKRC